MHYHEFAKTLLLGGSLEEKLMPPKDLEFNSQQIVFDIPDSPGRSNRYKFNNDYLKFPKKGSFHLDEKRAVAIHFFANHELLAIEMMAAGLLYYPVKSDSDILLKKGIVKTIIDEQKHLRLYLNRIKDFGVEFGDYPLNDFFWKQMKMLPTPTHFYSLMALTFESANLDFALYYEECFKEVEDAKSAGIMRTVFEDEISHVALGVHWLNQWRDKSDLWEYFSSHLPGLMTPARAKGIKFNRDSRLSAGLDLEFVDKLEKYSDDFGITNRKNW